MKDPLKNSVNSAVGHSLKVCQRMASLVLAGGAFLLLSPGVRAESEVSPILAPAPTLDLFWRDSSKLLQTQLNLLSQVEQSLYSSDLGYVRSSYRKLFFYIGELDEYLDQYGVLSSRTCTNENLTGDALDIYCTLFDSRGTMFALLAATERREGRLGSGEDSLLMPLGADPLLTAEVIPQERWRSEQDTFDVLVRDREKPSKNQGEIIRPAIAPLPATENLILEQTARILTRRSQLPEGFSLEPDRVFEMTTTRYQYVPVAQEYMQYQAFLDQPQTGISRLLPRDAYEEDFDRSRLRPDLEEQFPFPRLTESIPYPNLPLLIDNNGAIAFVPEGFNLGMISDLGMVALDDVAIDPAHPLVQYESPRTFEGLQQEQRRLLFQKENESFSRAPLQLNHTYLVRLIQYDFAEEILKGKAFPRYRFRELYLLADPPSYDVFVAIKPVEDWLDGGYTILWQILDQREARPIEDLIEYIEMDSPR